MQLKWKTGQNRFHMNTQSSQCNVVNNQNPSWLTKNPVVHVWPLPSLNTTTNDNKIQKKQIKKKALQTYKESNQILNHIISELHRT